MKFTRREFVVTSAAVAASACVERADAGAAQATPVISFEAFSDEFAQVVAIDGRSERLGQGFRWAEGPAWDQERQALYFTDVPANLAYRWTERAGIEVFLNPSGVAPELTKGMREPGANGLLMSQDGRLIVCNHGKRAVEKLDIQSGERELLVSKYEGARFNSPNDVIEADDGTLYFSDPPYGLDGLNASPLKELESNGVYRLTPEGRLTRIIDDMTFPNGVALTPDQGALLITQSDPAQPIVRRMDVEGHGQGHLWFDAAPFTQGYEGLPDGMAVATSGHVFVAGPGGVLVVTGNGECIGRIATGRATANCAFGRNGQTLFLTARDLLLSVETRVMGIGRF